MDTMQQLAQTPGASAKMRSYHSHSKPMATLMRFLFLLLLSFYSACALAAKPVPEKLEPLPAPPVMDGGSNDEPEVTITKQTGQTVEEFRAGGRLYMIKITPKIGPPYYLIDDRGDGKFSRQESLDSGLRPPRWVIHSF
jgi:hypothetical protein